VSERSDVIVVGGGLVGLACARALLRAGRAVHVLEAERVGAGASWGNCGLITPSHALPLTRPGMMRTALRGMLKRDSPVHVPPRLDLEFVSWGLRFAARCSKAGMLDAMRGRGALLERSRVLFDEWMDEGMACEWEAQGVIEVFATDAARTHSTEAARLLADHGVESEELEAEELATLEPALRPGMAGGRRFPRDAQLRPDGLIEALLAQVRAAGGTVEEGVRVSALTERGVETAAGPREAEVVVLATGAVAPQLAKGLGLKVPIQPGKGYSITSQRPAVCPNVPLLLAEANMAVTPWPSGVRLGGTMEFAGYDERLNHRRVEALRRGAARYLPEALGADPVEWWGWRPMTPDELPILDRVRPGLVLAVGHGMMGVSMAPATGELVAGLVTGQEQAVDPAPYALARF
jgi:D-amino-acid dehydrogenase